MTNTLKGLRVMVVEDEALVAMMTCDFLEDMGCDVVGPFPTVDQALQAILSDRVDCAVLDINLGGGNTSLPVAQALREKSKPFLFATGYGVSGSKDEFPAAPVLPKPFNEDQLARALEGLF